MTQISIIKKSELEGAMRLDAEYYQPKYFRCREILGKLKVSHQTLESLAKYITNGATPYHEDLTTGDVRFLTAEHIFDLHIDYPNSKFIKLKFHHGELKRTALRENDLLVTIKGKIGNAAVVFDLFGETNINQDVARVVLNDSVNPFYVAVFLDCKYGKLQSEQLCTNQINPFLGLGNLKQIKVPVLDDSICKEVEKLVRDSQSIHRQSESLYLQAEQILLDEISFKNLDLSHQLSYIVSYKKAREANRLDAEHFQPKYGLLIQHLANTGQADLLGNLVAQPIKRGLQPEYDSNGGALAFTEKDLGRYLLNVEGAQHVSEDFWRRTERGRVRKGDVLLYSIGAYIGRANAYLENAKAVASSNLTIIQTDKAKCNSVYLALYLNSPLGQLQAEKWTASVGQMALYPSDVPKFVVYLPSMEFQQGIADLVAQSWEASQKARQLLDEAKLTVENLIDRRTG